MKVFYYGYLVVKIEVNGKVILIDLFLIGNLKIDLKIEDVKVDVIFLLYGYGDYVGDIVEFVKKNNVVVVVLFELVIFLSW